MAWVFEGKEVLVCEKKNLTRAEIKELERRGARTMIFEDTEVVSGCHGITSSKTIRTRPSTDSCSNTGCGGSSCGSSSHKRSYSSCGSTSGCS